MANEDRPSDPGPRGLAEALLTQARQAALRASHALDAAGADLTLAEGRLDDRTWAEARDLLRRLIESGVAAVRERTVRRLEKAGETRLADAIGGGAAIDADVAATILFREPAVVREIIGRVRQEGIANALPPAAVPGGGMSLIMRLTEAADRGVARRATALLQADNRRRTGDPGQAALPADVQHRVTWAAAAALRATVGEAPFALDRAIVEGTERVLAAHDESEASEAAAIRLAAAIDADGDTLPDLLIEALGDGRLTLFIALLAHATGVDYPEMRDVTIERSGSRLWLVLRALGLARETIARIGWALGEADPLRAPETFATTLDAIGAVRGAEAWAAMAPLTLPADYRAARMRHERR